MPHKHSGEYYSKEGQKRRDNRNTGGKKVLRAEAKRERLEKEGPQNTFSETNQTIEPINGVLTLDNTGKVVIVDGKEGQSNPSRHER